IIMARPLRIEYPNACYHVSNRADTPEPVRPAPAGERASGSERADSRSGGLKGGLKAGLKGGLFPAEQYYQAFLDGVREAATRFNVEVLGWCLLKNEYHLLIRTPEGNLSRFMRQVDGLYTQYYQKHKRRRGSVFRARYKSV